MNNDEVISGFEAAKKVTPKGVEYWTARSMQKMLGYADWRNFVAVMEKAAVAVKGMGRNPAYQFVGFTNMVGIGSGARREYDDFYLTRFACYLIAMNGDATGNPRVAAAQEYFAIIPEQAVFIKSIHE